MKRYHGIFMMALLTATPALVWFPAGALAEERILDYHADIVVHKDANMTVTETIKVRAEGKAIKHGIFRDLPVTYRNSKVDGDTIAVDYKVISVLRDGKKEPYFLKEVDGYKRIYIGDAKVLLDPNDYIYTLKYQPTRPVLGYSASNDTLYWNVTGNGWTFVIDNASGTVSLPKGIPPKKIEYEAWTGKAGEKGESYKAERKKNGTIAFNTTRPLDKTEGLTICVSFPKGHVERPKEGGSGGDKGKGKGRQGPNDF